MKKSATLGVPLLALFVLAPMLASVLLVTLSTQAAECVRHTSSLGRGAGSGSLRVAQANIKVSLPRSSFRADLATVTDTGADLVSLNEVHRRTDPAITPAGYSSWRAPQPQRSNDGTAVLWRTDRWRKLDAGRVEILSRGPQKWDDGRGATWVTLDSVGTGVAVKETGASGAARRTATGAASGAVTGTVSMVSVHHMINPAKYGPNKPLRRRLYRQGMTKIADLVTTLSAQGPVFVAGDFNSQWAANDPWGPRRLLGPGRLADPEAKVAMETTMDQLGRLRTHDSGGTIDYVFYQPAGATPTAQKSVNLHSDHHLLHADFTLGDTTPGAARGPTSDTTSSRGATGRSAQQVSNPTSGGDGSRLGLSPIQWKRAAEVVAAGKSMGISGQGIVIALAVASQESGFRVYANDGRGGDLAADQHGLARSLRLPHDAVGTDHGSLGIFQQQWPWWGTMEQLMNPAASARAFYQALLETPGWQDLPLTVTAQTVQRSAYPAAYADDEPLAHQIYAELADTPAEPPGNSLFLTGAEDAACATQLVASGAVTGAGAVVLPVPAHLADSDRHNWGGGGASWSSWHTGTDFSAACATPVLATHAGTVEIDTNQGWAGRWLVKITRGPGQLTTWYAHMQKVLVDDGQTVTPGEQIGEVGTEGNSTGCHLHFEVHTKNGSIYGPDNVDPSTWLTQHLSARSRGGSSATGADKG